MKKLLFIAVMILWTASAHAANWYLDCQVGSSGNGQSWATAWKALSDISGVSANDIVYISGSGSCSAYSGNGSGQWSPAAGSSGNPIIYRAGQDAGHNSALTITLSGAPGVLSATNIYIDGNYGGSRNITINGSIGAAGSTAFNGARFSYLNINSNINGTTFQNFQLDNCLIQPPVNSDHAFTSGASAGAIGYTLNSIHDNIVMINYLPGGGTGDDGFQWIENVTFYNNYIIGVPNASQNTQHQDGVQTGGSYVDIHDNYFENLQDSSIYGDFFGNPQHWRIYNNIMNYTSNTSGLQAVPLGFENGSLTMNDFIVANNTIYTSTQADCININTGALGVATNIYVVNNICDNTNAPRYNTGSGGSVTMTNNFTGTSGLGFVSQSAYPNQDYHLTSAATNAIGQGINPSYLTNVYTTDRDGNTRVAPWDLGAYGYNLSGTTYTVGGTMSGLAPSNSVTLTDTNAGTQSFIGTMFTMPNALSTGTAYNVTVSVQPSGQNCAMAYGAGTIAGANVTNMRVVCINNAKGSVIVGDRRIH